MKCPYCDFENRDDAVSCEMCDMPLKQLTRKRPASRPAATQSAKPERPPRIVHPEEYDVFPTVGCPNCGTPLEGCAPIVKTTVKSTGGGYGLFSGCCGTIILGPLGLLCGLRKQNITSSNQTWWVCRKCGKEFIEKDAAKEVADSVITSSAAMTGIIAFFWQIMFRLFGYSAWIRNIALLIIAGTWIIIPERIRETTGYEMKQLLVHEERVVFYKKSAFYGVICFGIGMFIGAKIAEYLLL